VHTELAEWSIELLIYLSQLPQGLAVRPQRLRYRPGMELLEEHTAIVVIRFLETNQGKHGRSGVRVIRPHIVVTAVAHTRSDHAKPGGRDLRLDAAVVPRECVCWGRRRYGDAGRGAVHRTGK